MHIIEIILDGFKSYSEKTHITQLDKNFNAITGLNGSGKSNILDAICFVLGISSLAHVRVTNLQELIYKRGNAGIDKASVTIIFDNRDKSCGPPSMI
jgi:structural maintenance of chromosome 2